MFLLVYFVMVSLYFYYGIVVFSVLNTWAEAAGDGCKNDRSLRQLPVPGHVLQ